MSETHVALCSGGMDSTVATHAAVRFGPADLVVHLDTGTGLDENEQYVRRLAREIGAQPWTLGTHEDYETIVAEHGFPGPSRHGIIYRRLKERQIQKLAATVDELHCWTGVRSLESDRRMRTVEPEGDHDGGRWYWHAPIHDWTKDDCRRYIDRFDLPRNPLWDTLGRSGDCFCGCFGSREELLDLRAAECDYHAEWLEELEGSVEIGDETGRWAWASMSHSEQRAERVDEDQMRLCSTCGDGQVPATDGGQITENTEP